MAGDLNANIIPLKRESAETMQNKNCERFFAVASHFC